MNQIAGVSLPNAMQHGRFIQMLQMTQILAQVQSARIRLLDVIVVHVKLLAVVLELDENFPGLNVDAARLLVESDCAAEAASMHQPHFLAFCLTVIQTVAIFVRFRLEN